jgi:hypothetical protein
MAGDFSDFLPIWMAGEFPTLVCRKARGSSCTVCIIVAQPWIKLELSKTFNKLPNIKFHENTSKCLRAVYTQGGTLLSDVQGPKSRRKDRRKECMLKTEKNGRKEERRVWLGIFTTLPRNLLVGHPLLHNGLERSLCHFQTRSISPCAEMCAVLRATARTALRVGQPTLRGRTQFHVSPPVYRFRHEQ